MKWWNWPAAARYDRLQGQHCFNCPHAKRDPVTNASAPSCACAAGAGGAESIREREVGSGAERVPRPHEHRIHGRRVIRDGREALGSSVLLARRLQSAGGGSFRCCCAIAGIRCCRKSGTSRTNARAGARGRRMSLAPLLLELGTEELPVKALPGLAQALFDGVIAALEKRGIAVERGDAKPLYTPRRLAVCLPGVATEQPEQRSEVLGPYLNVALDSDGQPTKALLASRRRLASTGPHSNAGLTPRASASPTPCETRRRARATCAGCTCARPSPRCHIPKTMRWGDTTTRSRAGALAVLTARRRRGRRGLFGLRADRRAAATASCTTRRCGSRARLLRRRVARRKKCWSNLRNAAHA